MRACPGRGMYVWRKRVSDSFLWRHCLRPCYPRKDRMDLMPGYFTRMSCHRFDLPLPVFRGSKGPIRKHLLLQQLRRPYRIHTPLVPANAVIMWYMECVWISYRMRLRLYVCEARFSSPTVFSIPVSLWNPRVGCAAVGLVAGQGGPVCM
jgi:hypothetical protein